MILRAITLAIAVTAVLLAAAGATPAAAATHPCDRAGGTVAKNRFVRVYFADDYFACSYENGKTVELGYVASSSTGFFDAFDFTVAGRFVAYTRVECSGFSGGPCEVDELRVIDMGRLKQTMRHPFGASEGLAQVVLKANGSVAYLVGTYDRSGQRTGTALHRRDRRGRWMLAAGTGDAAPRDLRLVGSTLHWREGERERSKALQ